MSQSLETDDLQKFIQTSLIGIPLSLFETLYQHQNFDTPLEHYYNIYGVTDAEGLCHKIPDVAMLTSTKRVMYAPVVKDRRKRLEGNVVKLLEAYGMMLFDYFERYYKEMFRRSIIYEYYGLTDLDHLCEVFKDNLEVRFKEVTVKSGRVVKVKEIHLVKYRHRYGLSN